MSNTQLLHTTPTGGRCGVKASSAAINATRMRYMGFLLGKCGDNGNPKCRRTALLSQEGSVIAFCAMTRGVVPQTKCTALEPPPHDLDTTNLARTGLSPNFPIRCGTMKRQTRLVAFLVVLAVARSSAATTPEERRAYLDKLVQTLPAVPSFNAWQKRTSELPPDFEALPKINGLPDPLRFLDGHMLKSAADWKARRSELLVLEQKYDLGTFPPKPKLDNVVVLSEDNANGQITRNLRLEF